MADTKNPAQSSAPKMASTHVIDVIQGEYVDVNSISISILQNVCTTTLNAGTFLKID